MNAYFFSDGYFYHCFIILTRFKRHFDWVCRRRELNGKKANHNFESDLSMHVTFQNILSTLSFIAFSMIQRQTWALKMSAINHDQIAIKIFLVSAARLPILKCFINKSLSRIILGILLGRWMFKTNHVLNPSPPTFIFL